MYAEFLFFWYVALRRRSTDIANTQLRRRILFGEVVAVECANHKNTRMHCAGKMHSFQMSQHVANVTTTMSDSVQCGGIVSCSCPEASCHEDVALGGVELQFHAFLISAIHSSEWSASRLCCVNLVSDGEKLFWPLNQLGLVMKIGETGNCSFISRSTIS